MHFLCLPNVLCDTYQISNFLSNVYPLIWQHQSNSTIGKGQSTCQSMINLPLPLTSFVLVRIGSSGCNLVIECSTCMDIGLVRIN